MSAPINTFRGRFLPYCLVRLGDGRYIAVNRDYKPIGGTRADGWVDYDSHPHAVKLNGLTPQRIARLAVKGEAEPDGRIYLYNDGCVPTSSQANWDAYAARLAILAKLTIDV